ncbi:hypothetical protein AMS68_003212 [Peltaster fructicola]|uniref:NAD-dependent epimerase/dehydratase domain-containing protein n=1 Tax=Peltaster fructicola TaxID=286661 RepID=A0A6H0XSS1_9PEZI|nr:hypothetical protein AMS68_003212 [Peltaster fructicola]
MTLKIFITGVTGYIGGDAAYAIAKAHPEYEYAFLVRTQEKADVVKKAFPDCRTVIGDNDSTDLLKKEAAEADIVLHTADSSDNENAAKAIRDGLIAGHSKEKPGFWLHTGGTGILTTSDAKAGNVGVYSDKLYNDWDRVHEVTSLPDDAFHRNVDIIVLEASKKHSDVLKTVIVCPPTIYGKGRGPSSTRGRQAYELSKMVLQQQVTPIFGEGKARWFNVHVHDLSDVFVRLVDAVADKNLSPEIWGEKGYLFTENGQHYWSELARVIGKEAVKAGFVSSAPEKVLSQDAAEKQAGSEGVSWSLNSRAEAIRARKVLGWSPKERSLEDEVPTIVQSEHELLSKK